MRFSYSSVPFSRQPCNLFPFDFPAPKMQRTFESYCAAATAHGFLFVGNPDLAWPLRTAWAVVTLVALVLAAVMVGQTLREWDEDPLVTDIELFAFQPGVRKKLSIITYRILIELWDTVQCH